MGQRQTTWHLMLVCVCLKEKDDATRRMTCGPNFENTNRKHPPPQYYHLKKRKPNLKHTFQGSHGCDQN